MRTTPSHMMIVVILTIGTVVRYVAADTICKTEDDCQKTHSTGKSDLCIEPANSQPPRSASNLGHGLLVSHNWYTIANKKSGKVLSVSGGSVDDGAQIIHYKVCPPQPLPCPCSRSSCEERCKKQAKEKFEDCMEKFDQSRTDICETVQETEENECKKGCQRCTGK